MEKTKVTYMDVDSPIPHANNPRLNGNAVDAVAASIEEFGFKAPIVVDGENVIIDGEDAIAKGYAKLAEDIDLMSGEDDAWRLRGAYPRSWQA